MIIVVRCSQFIFDNDDGVNYNTTTQLVRQQRLEFRSIETNDLKQLYII